MRPLGCSKWETSARILMACWKILWTRTVWFCTLLIRSQSKSPRSVSRSWNWNFTLDEIFIWTWCVTVLGIRNSWSMSKGEALGSSMSVFLGEVIEWWWSVIGLLNSCTQSMTVTISWSSIHSIGDKSVHKFHFFCYLTAQRVNRNWTDEFIATYRRTASIINIYTQCDMHAINVRKNQWISLFTVDGLNFHERQPRRCWPFFGSDLAWI